MKSSATHDSKHKMAAYPPNLVHGNDGGGRERLEKLQNHFERLVSFGFQHHHDGLKGENHPLRFLLKYRIISRRLQIKGCMYETIPPKPFPVRLVLPHRQTRDGNVEPPGLWDTFQPLLRLQTACTPSVASSSDRTVSHESHGYRQT